MLKLPKALREDAAEGIIYRTSYVTGKITRVGSYNRYDVEIAESGKSIKNVFVNDINITYVVGDTVGVGYEDANREKLIIIGKLRDITVKEVTGGVNALGV